SAVGAVSVRAPDRLRVAPCGTSALRISSARVGSSAAASGICPNNARAAPKTENVTVSNEFLRLISMRRSQALIAGHSGRRASRHAPNVTCLVQARAAYITVAQASEIKSEADAERVEGGVQVDDCCVGYDRRRAGNARCGVGERNALRVVAQV